jgi:hypothetical protein
MPNFEERSPSRSTRRIRPRDAPCELHAAVPNPRLSPRAAAIVYAPLSRPVPPNRYALVPTTENVCPLRGAGELPLRAGTSHVTDCCEGNVHTRGGGRRWGGGDVSTRRGCGWCKEEDAVGSPWLRRAGARVGCTTGVNMRRGIAVKSVFFPMYVFWECAPWSVFRRRCCLLPPYPYSCGV